MDLTALTIAVLIAVGLLATETVLRPASVAVEVAIAPKIDSISIDKGTLAAAFRDQLEEIVSTSSLVATVASPEIRSKKDQGVGMALAEAVNADNVAYALQRMVGYDPGNIRFALFLQDGALKGFITGSSRLVGNFNQVVSPNPGETVIAFTQRSALWAASQLAPYATALYLLQKHAEDKDFTDVIALVEHAKSLLPPTPTSFDRSLFDNLSGLVALFKNDPQSARSAFDNAITADPTNPVPFLNAAFTDMQFNEYQRAADRMARLVRIAPPANKVLLATAYMTWGAALMGLHDPAGADRMLAKAHEINPQSSSALVLWSEAKSLAGNQADADRLHRLAREAAAAFENYGEVAALYFRLSWIDDEPVIRSNFSNPTVVRFH